MRTRAVVAGVVTSGAVLAVGWQIGAASSSSSSDVAVAVVDDAAGEPSPSGEGPAAPVEAPSTVTGDAVETDYGVVQVEVTVADGVLTDVEVVQQTDSGSRSEQINGRALPALTEAALEAQSADIDAVSGATYTSAGYLASLQSALDQAGL